MKKSGDFFLEEESKPAIDLMAVFEAETPMPTTEAEPIVVSDAELTSVAGDVVTNINESDLNPPELEAPNLTEATGPAQNSEAAHESSINVAVVDLPEPTIIDSLPQIAPAVDDAAATGEKFQPVVIEAAPASEEFAKADAVVTPSEFVTTGPDWRDEEIAALNVSAVEARPEIVSTPNLENEFAATPVIMVEADESSARADIQSANATANDNLPGTLRERVVGWFKRTFNKFLALIGATGEKE